MGVFDLILGALLIYALYKGVQQGLFVALASLVSLVIGIYIAIKFSTSMRDFVGRHLTWSPNSVEFLAFALTFLAVVVGIHLLAKVLTGIANFAFLGWINTLAGGLFGMLKMVLLLSIVFNLFQKINYDNMLVKEETLNNSTFYNPIQKTAQFIFPKLQAWYDEVKKEHEQSLKDRSGK